MIEELLTRKELLKLRLSLIIIRDKYTFCNTAFEFSNRLYKHFGNFYIEEEIERCLNEFEESMIIQNVEETVVEIPEQFKLENV
jgi:hypothetical protein